MHNQVNHIHYWQLQEAKARLSELVKTVIAEGPQGISIRGSQEVIVISKRDFDNLTHAQQSFWQFIRDSPLVGIDLDLTRDKSNDRNIEL